WKAPQKQSTHLRSPHPAASRLPPTCYSEEPYRVPGTKPSKPLYSVQHLLHAVALVASVPIDLVLTAPYFSSQKNCNCSGALPGAGARLISPVPLPLLPIGLEAE